MLRRSSLACGLMAAFSLLAASSLVSRPSTAQAGAPGSFEPARPRDLVSFHSAQVPGAVSVGYTTIPAGGETVVTTVPADRWLVVRDVATFYTGVAGAIQLFEVRAGVSTLRWSAVPNPLSSSSGVSFAPGSQVVLRDVVGTQAIQLRYALTGYLVE
jgi:hypothetical protein